MSDEVYYQFPLSLLAGFEAEDLRLHAITSYCAMEIGRAAIAGFTKDQKRELFLENESIRPAGCSYAQSDHVAIIAGFKKLGMYGGGADRICNDHCNASSVIGAMYHIQGGQSPLVRIRSDLMWAPTKEEMTYRQFSVVCAVYSSIGGKKFPYQVTRDAIRARAMGYKASSLIFDQSGKLTDSGKAILEKRADKAQPLSVDQVR